MPWLTTCVVALNDQLLFPLQQEEGSIIVISTGTADIRENGLLLDRFYGDRRIGERRARRQPFWVVVRAGATVRDLHPEEVLSLVFGDVPILSTPDAPSPAQVYCMPALELLIT